MLVRRWEKEEGENKKGRTRKRNNDYHLDVRQKRLKGQKKTQNVEATKITGKMSAPLI